MAVAFEHPPARAAGQNGVAVEKPRELRRQLWHAARVSVAAPLHRREVVGAHPVATKELDDSADAEAAVLLTHRVRGHVLGVRHRDRRVETCGEPFGIADVIGMAMRRHDPSDRPVRERRLELPKPQRARRLVADTAIDEREAVLLVEQPYIDVIERERQRHSNPSHARRDDPRVAGGGRRTECVVEQGG
jgi:hypothetical protein